MLLTVGLPDPATFQKQRQQQHQEQNNTQHQQRAHSGGHFEKSIGGGHFEKSIGGGHFEKLTNGGHFERSHLLEGSQSIPPDLSSSGYHSAGGIIGEKGGGGGDKNSADKYSLSTSRHRNTNKVTTSFNIQRLMIKGLKVKYKFILHIVKHNILEFLYNGVKTAMSVIMCL